MKNTQRFHIGFRLPPSKSASGECCLYVRVYIDSMRTELSTRLHFLPKHWDAVKGKVKPSHPDYQHLNTRIDDITSEIRREFLMMAATTPLVKLDDLKRKYLKVEEKPVYKTLCEAFDYHNAKVEQLVKVGKLSEETLVRYKITKKKIVEFMQAVYKVNDKPLKDLKYHFVTDLEHYFLTVQKLHCNTTYKYIKNLKKIVFCAQDADWISKNPFYAFKSQYIWRDRDVLLQEEIDTLMNADIKIARLAEVRDVFIFCCYTGFAYIDTFNFERDAVMRGLDGEYWLKAHRQKTKVKESVPLLPIPLKIIERYRDHEYCVKYNKLLPINTNQRYNAYLKELADLCGIKKNLTTHLARHTFATTITLSNGVPIETVSSMLGHKNIKTTQIYAKVVEKKVSEDMKSLREKLKGLDGFTKSGTDN
jgi:site-specific recombinase XerD